MPPEINQHKKLLIITYYWPPAGGPGVQRWLKFVKYLPDFGFDPVVLTVDEKLASYAITDTSLINEIPSEVKVYRTRTRELFSIYLKLTKKNTIPFSGFVHEGKTSLREKLIWMLRTHLFIPDPRKGWNRFASRKAAELIRQENIQYVVTTSPPHSSQLIGLKLQKKFPSIVWLADFRDPWTRLFYFDELNHSLFSRWFHQCLEKRILSGADKVVVVSNSMKQDFLADHKETMKDDKIFVIPNGYDEADFAGEKPSPEKEFTLTYTGTLAGKYKIDSLLEAIENINRTGKSRVKLRFVGEVCAEYITKMKDTVGSGCFELVPMVPHKKAIEYILRSQLLLLVIPDAPNNESIITGKIFEYLAARKPILAIGPVRGDAARVLADTHAGIMFGYSDTLQIQEFLLDLTDTFNRGESLWQGRNIEKFSRVNLTGKLAQLF